MKHKDLLSTIIAGRGIVTVITLVGVVVGILLITVFNLGIGVSVSLINFALLILVNSLVIVQPGYSGYLKVFEVLRKKSYPQGIHFVFPFISTMKEVDVRLREHQCINENMYNIDSRLITVEYVLNYRLNETLVHFLPRFIEENTTMHKALCHWLDSCFNQVISSKTYDEINGKIGNIQKEVQTLFEAKVKTECMNFDSKAEKLFSQISISILKIEFDTEYQKSQSELAVEENRIRIIEKKTEQRIKLAKASAKAKKIEADAEAEAMRRKGEAEADILKMKGVVEAETLKKKGDAENELAEREGEIIDGHPNLIKSRLAENFPKVMGGNTIINLDEILK